MITIIEDELGVFSSHHKYNPDEEPNQEYIEWALSIRSPIDTSEAYSYQDEQMSYAM